MTETDPTTTQEERLAPPPASRSDAAPKRKDKKESGESRHPWRDNIEAITMAIVMAVMLKYFIVEAYKIPTGSMQPTLMGNKEAQIFDRILVDKLSFHFRDPKRFEVVVFKYPLDVSKNFIKRLVGVGPEELRILYGDLWHRADATEDWRVLRRPRPVLGEVLKPLHPGLAAPEWKALPEDGGDWTVKAGRVEASGPGSLRYPPTGSVHDDYLDGYPLKIRNRMRAPRSHTVVGDLRVDGEVRADERCTGLALRFTEGDRRYLLRLPGPAAGADERPTVRVEPTRFDGAGSSVPAQEVAADEPFRLPAGRWIEFGGENIDDRLRLEIDGDPVLELDVPFANPDRSDVLVTFEGGGGELRELMVYRDIYYTTARANRTEWVIPAGHYVMLGDNTQDSSDSREWQWARFEWPGEDRLLRGNLRKADPEVPNPWIVAGDSGRELWFRDEWGELYHAPYGRSDGSPTELQEEDAPLVPRELVTGRAVVVFWPFKWDLKLWRLRWIR